MDRYEEALEKARRLYKRYKERGIAWSSVDIESIFPEIKEEKMIKILIEKALSESSLTSEEVQDVLVWLDNQDVKSTEWSEEDETKRNRCIHLLEIDKYHGENESIINWLKSLRPHSQWRPKYNIGDWIVYYGNTLKIENISLGKYKYYECLWTDGTIRTFDCEFIDSEAHLWTVGDIKPGDILYDETCIFMVKIFKPGEPTQVYFCMFRDGDFVKDVSLNLYIEKFQPASSKQRKSFFQVMNRKGYRLNNKLRKEKEMTEPKFKVGDKIQCYQGCGTVMTIERIEDGKYIFADDRGRVTVEDGNNWKLVESEVKAWSEEDGREFESVLWHLRNSVNNGDTENSAGELEGWLNSLKCRVQSQQGWSEEDRMHLRRCISYVESSMNPREDDVKWLKSLMQRNILPLWEARNVTEMCEKYSTLTSYKPHYKDIIKGDIQYQPYWKPSDEQIKALEHVITFLKGSTMSGILESLYNDIKKLTK